VLLLFQFPNFTNWLQIDAQCGAEPLIAGEFGFCLRLPSNRKITALPCAARPARQSPIAAPLRVMLPHAAAIPVKVDRLK
jgi:hypothetical protein